MRYERMVPLGLHRQTLAVARERGERQLPSAEDIGHRAVAGLEGSIDLDRVPALGVADVPDLDVVVLAPEKRNRIEALAAAEDVTRRRLALALSDDPVLDADSRARVRIRPPRDVASGEDARRAGFEVLVDGDAPIQRKPGLLGQRRRGPDAGADDDEVGVERGAAAER